MGIVTVQVVWNGETYDLEFDTSKDVASFKQSLYQLTGVPETKQKIMSKSKGLWKGLLKDTEDLTQFTWENGMKLSMMGNSEGVPKRTKTENIVFVEDMTAKQQQAIGKTKPPGLENLGNTCYMNSTLQCLKAIPELRKSLESVENKTNMNQPGKQMTVSLKNLFDQMDSSKDSVTPTLYVSTMRQTFPQFAQLGPKGTGYTQQDADEYFNSLITEMSKYLTNKVEDVEYGNENNAIDALFGIDTTVEMKCLESETEKIVTKTERLKRLQCKIDEQVRTLEDGIKVGFEGELEKNSQVLERNAKWKTTQKLHRLPLYLVVQFNRFYWKVTPESRDHQGINCKIRKPVKFPFELDIYQFCDDELKEIIKPARDAHTQKLIAISNGGAKQLTEEEKELQAAMLLSNTGKTAGPGIPPTFRGVYELFGVVTHKGRASDSGHYIGWVKQGVDSWVCFDDDYPSECKDEDIAKLSGETADWHIAYMAYYRVKID